MAKKLINYLPEVLRNYREFQKTFEAEEPEFENLQDELSKVLNDLFVKDATERGVKRWENILGIVSKPSENLEDRKFKILSKLVKKLPYTYRRLEQLLGALCGEDGYLLEIVEGTTNLVTDQSFWNPRTGAIVTRELVTSGQWAGWHKVHVTRTGTGARGFIGNIQLISVAVDSTHTWSIDFYSETGKIKPRLDGYYGIQDLSRVDERRWALTWTNNRGSAGIQGIYFYHSDGAEIDVDEIFYYRYYQVEKKPYPTPFVDGTRLYNYTVKVRVALTRKNMFDDVKILLQEVVPANHIVDLSLLYNQHFTVAQYTHGELSTWTHDYIRNEVLE